MNAVADLVAEALGAGLLLSRKGEHIHIESPLGEPLPEGLRERLAAQREAVLAWLDWCALADELILATSRRIGARHPRGCPLDDRDWRAAEEVLNAAYLSQDLAVLRAALARYEEFANERFEAYERRVR